MSLIKKIHSPKPDVPTVRSKAAKRTHLRAKTSELGSVANCSKTPQGQEKENEDFKQRHSH